MNLFLLAEYAKSFIGRPYNWGANPGGGDDPLLGFDCSGLVCELLRASGEVPYNYRTNAQGIYEYGKTKLWTKRAFGPGELGTLAFYGADLANINHVGFCLNDYSMIEAGGGNAETGDLSAAAARNAFVRLRPIYYRKDFLGFLKPFYSPATH